MRKLKIDTYSCSSGELQDSLSIPPWFGQSRSKYNTSEYIV
ncbi:hypothetical protein WOC18_23180 [Vibrio parahaemolyticus]